MQIKKKEVKDKIVKAAYKEFREKGYEKASIRSIAALAGVTKGSIYTYFKNKDELYCHIVKPGLDVVIGTMTDDYGEEHSLGTFDEVYQYDQSVKEFRLQVQEIIEYKDLIYMLFFRSSGSSLEDYKERIIQRYEKSSRYFYKVIGEANPNLNTDVTELFIHSCAILYIGFIEEILIHEPDEETIEKFAKEMTSFVHFGTEKVIKIK